MKKLIGIVITMLLLFLCFFSVAGVTDSKTILYLDYGNVSFYSYGIVGYDENGNLVSDTNENGYIITQSNPNIVLEKSISVVSGNHNIEIKDLNIEHTNENSYAISVSSNSGAEITISGENHLVSGTYRAGLEISSKANVTINGNGTLYAQSELEAGIGGGNGKSNGTLVINSGTIYATGGINGYSAGIGGGSSGKGGNITINGGNIIAVGGIYAAGIGGGNISQGGNITINGGTVTAIGGENAAGIGGGFAGNGGNIIINGGSVKAVAGAEASAIGNGKNCSTAFSGIHNSKGNAVSLTVLPIKDFSLVYQNGINSVPITLGHADDENLYFYSDSTFNVATVYQNNNSVKFYSYNNQAFNELLPFADSCERFSEYLICNISAETLTADGFSLENTQDGFNLIYNDIPIDNFKTLFRGDMNFDNEFDAEDSLIANCIVENVLNDELLKKLADYDNDGSATLSDVEALFNCGLMLPR